jgi:hypothetical protein
MSRKNQPANATSLGQAFDPMADPIDAVLLAEFNSAEQIRPSSGFALSVMDAIHEQTTVPAPIPFPWKRVLPLAIAALCSLMGFAIWVAQRSHTPFSSSFAISLPAFTPFAATLGWTALALALTLAVVSMSFRLATGKGR